MRSYLCEQKCSQFREFPRGPNMFKRFVREFQMKRIVEVLHNSAWTRVHDNNAASQQKCFIHIMRYKKTGIFAFVSISRAYAAASIPGLTHPAR